MTNCSTNMTNCSGATAHVSSMLRSIDMVWYIDALGAAARAGVGVFCKETLVGDWLETIGSWQQGASELPLSSQEREPSEGEVGRVMFSFDGEPTDLKVIELH